MTTYDHKEEKLFKACGITDKEHIMKLTALESRARKMLFKNYPEVSISRFIEEFEKILTEEGLDYKDTSMIVGMIVNNIILVTVDILNKEKEKNQKIIINTKGNA